MCYDDRAAIPCHSGHRRTARRPGGKRLSPRTAWNRGIRKGERWELGTLSFVLWLSAALLLCWPAAASERESDKVRTQKSLTHSLTSTCMVCFALHSFSQLKKKKKGSKGSKVKRDVLHEVRDPELIEIYTGERRSPRPPSEAGSRSPVSSTTDLLKMEAERAAMAFVADQAMEEAKIEKIKEQSQVRASGLLWHLACGIWSVSTCMMSSLKS